MSPEKAKIMLAAVLRDIAEELETSDVSEFSSDFELVEAYLNNVRSDLSDKVAGNSFRYFGIKGIQLEILNQIAFYGARTTPEIAKRLDKSTQYISTYLKKMFDKNMLQREPFNDPTGGVIFEYSLLG